MERLIHRADSRGGGDHGWLKTKYSFSFADWYEPSRMGFGSLRVINDDSIAPDSGFGAHQHKDMEIITIVMDGTVTHKDSMGNEGTVKAGEVQVMSAGTGVVHSEFNVSKDEPLSLFQIWIEPKSTNIAPRYAQHAFGRRTEPGLTTLVSPEGSEEGLHIHQDAYIYEGVVNAAHPLTYSLKSEEGKVYVLVIDGTLIIEGDTLEKRDAMGFWDTKDISIQSPSAATFLLIEVS
ncbi:MAG: hypothetical protein JWN64_408 [Parcubacteria group bacterium]|nr:hypothetical protein [Parcubacteria group bacterium]